MKSMVLKPLFVESFPDLIDDDVLYVSMSFASAVHRCACGCGQEVVTPLSPTDWKLYFDGENVSLEPSIGNWGFPCRSHYWIRGGKIRWSGSMSESEIYGGRARDGREKSHFYEDRLSSNQILPNIVARDDNEAGRVASRFQRIKRWIGAKKKQ